MVLELPSVAALAILARPPELLPTVSYKQIRREQIRVLEDSFLPLAPTPGPLINPLMLAAATNHPQIVESLVQWMSDSFTLDVIRDETLAPCIASAAGALDFLEYWTARFGALVEPDECLFSAVEERRWTVTKWLLQDSHPWRQIWWISCSCLPNTCCDIC
jgi:hypothetical protein